MNAWSHGISEIAFGGTTHREAGNRPWNKSVSRHPFNPTRMLARWAKLLGVPRLPTVVTVEFSTRLTRSMGRVRPAKRCYLRLPSVAARRCGAPWARLFVGGILLNLEPKTVHGVLSFTMLVQD